MGCGATTESQAEQLIPSRSQVDTQSIKTTTSDDDIIKILEFFNGKIAELMENKTPYTILTPFHCRIQEGRFFYQTQVDISPNIYQLFTPPECRDMNNIDHETSDPWCIGLILLGSYLGRDIYNKIDKSLFTESYIYHLFDGVDVPFHLLYFIIQCLKVNPNQRCKFSDFRNYHYVNRQVLSLKEHIDILIYQSKIDLNSNSTLIGQLRLCADNEDYKSLRINETDYIVKEINYFILIKDCLKLLTHLTELNFKKCGMESSGLNVVSQSFRLLPRLQKLNLFGNRLGKDSMDILLDRLKYNELLTSLDLNVNQIGPEGAEILSNLFIYITRLESLEISNNGILDDGTISISQKLHYLPSLQLLNLSSNFMENSITNLSDSLIYISNLKSFQLGNNLLNGIGVGKLSRSFKYITDLDELDLSGNDFKSEGLKNLLSHLSSLKKLSKFNISNTNLVDVHLLASQLHYITQLQEINISDNSIKGSNLEYLFNHLSILKRLRVLKLSNLSIDNKIFNHNLLPELSYMPYLREIYLDGNDDICINYKEKLTVHYPKLFVVK